MVLVAFSCSLIPLSFMTSGAGIDSAEANAPVQQQGDQSEWANNLGKALKISPSGPNAPGGLSNQVLDTFGKVHYTFGMGHGLYVAFGQGDLKQGAKIFAQATADAAKDVATNLIGLGPVGAAQSVVDALNTQCPAQRALVGSIVASQSTEFADNMWAEFSRGKSDKDLAAVSAGDFLNWVTNWKLKGTVYWRKDPRTNSPRLSLIRRP